MACNGLRFARWLANVTSDPFYGCTRRHNRTITCAGKARMDCITDGVSIQNIPKTWNGREILWSDQREILSLDVGKFWTGRSADQCLLVSESQVYHDTKDVWTSKRGSDSGVYNHAFGSKQLMKWECPNQD